MQQTQHDLKAMSLVELKAMAYDTIGQKEQVQINLDIINSEIRARIEKQEIKDNSPVQ
jgi:hypothetical protein